MMYILFLMWFKILSVFFCLCYIHGTQGKDTMKDKMTQNADSGSTWVKGVKTLCTISNFNFPII